MLAEQAPPPPGFVLLYEVRATTSSAKAPAQFPAQKSPAGMISTCAAELLMVGTFRRPAGGGLDGHILRTSQGVGVRGRGSVRAATASRGPAEYQAVDEDLPGPAITSTETESAQRAADRRDVVREVELPVEQWPVIISKENLGSRSARS